MMIMKSSWILYAIIIVITILPQGCYSRCAMSPSLYDMFTDQPYAVRINVTDTIPENNEIECNGQILNRAGRGAEPHIAEVLEVLKNDNKTLYTPAVGDQFVLFLMTDTGFQTWIRYKGLQQKMDDGFVVFPRLISSCANADTTPTINYVASVNDPRNVGLFRGFGNANDVDTTKSYTNYNQLPMMMINECQNLGNQPWSDLGMADREYLRGGLSYEGPVINVIDIPTPPRPEIEIEEENSSPVQQQPQQQSGSTSVEDEENEEPDDPCLESRTSVACLLSIIAVLWESLYNK